MMRRLAYAPLVAEGEWHLEVGSDVARDEFFADI